MAKITSIAPTLNIKISDIEVDHKNNQRLLKDKKAGSYSDGARKSEDGTDVKSLAASIKKNFLQPLEVVPTPKGKKPYSLVSGFRRMEAITKILGWHEDTQIPCTVRDETIANDSVLRTVSNLVENIQREKLAPAELAIAFVKLEATGLSGKAIADKVGLNANYVNNLLRLKKGLSPKIWAEFEKGASDATQAFLLTIVVKDAKEQEQIFFNRRAEPAAAASSEGEGEGSKGTPGGATAGEKKTPTPSMLEQAEQVAREDLRALGEKGEPSARMKLVGVIEALVWARLGGRCPVSLPTKEAVKAAKEATKKAEAEVAKATKASAKAANDNGEAKAN